MTGDEMARLIRSVIRMGHHSTLEHASFQFAVEGVSRALTHQLVRHRLASYSQQSQRYVSQSGFVRVTPPTIRRHPAAEAVFNAAMARAGEAYDELIRLGVPKEDARYVLPNAAETKIVISMNARALLHFFELRCCTRAQWEIRAMAYRMLREVKAVAPLLFENAGPPCTSLGLCREGSRSCGRIKRLKRKRLDFVVAPIDGPQGAVGLGIDRNGEGQK